MTNVETTDGGSSMVTPFGVEVRGAPTAPVVVVRGEIDVATSPELRNQLAALVTGGAKDITLEFSEVSFVDSSGLGVLVGTYKRLRDDGGNIRIVGAQASVRKVFEITGLQGALLDD
jgi:anti-sigma B factor antagonist